MISYNKFVACMRIFQKIGCYMKRQNCGIKHNSDTVLMVASHYDIDLENKMYPISYEEDGKSYYIILAFATDNLSGFITNTVNTEYGEVIVIICPNNVVIDNMTNEDLLDSLGSICEVIINDHGWHGDMYKISSDIIYASLVYTALSEAFNINKALKDVFNKWVDKNILGYIVGRVENFKITCDVCEYMNGISKSDFYNYSFIPVLNICKKSDDYDEKSGD